MEDNNGGFRKVSSSLYNMCCCFGSKQCHHRHHYHRHPQEDAASSSATTSPVHPNNCRLLRSSSGWLKSRAHDHLPEIKDKCRGLISRIGRGRHHDRRRHSRCHSADFHYDVLSYYRNFDEGADDESNGEEFPFHSFSSRLPRSPPGEEDDEEALYKPSSQSTTTTTTTTAAKQINSASS